VIDLQPEIALTLSISTPQVATTIITFMIFWYCPSQLSLKTAIANIATKTGKQTLQNFFISLLLLPILFFTLISNH
jgi:hypothetical protein